MRFETMVEVCGALHLSYDMSGEYKQRGGIIFVAPPGELKTTAVETVELFPHARVISNLTVKSLSAMRQDFISGRLRTLAFSDLENIYRRHGSVSEQIEGVLMGLVDEGFRNPSYSDQRTTVMPARCAIVAGMAIKAYEDRISKWIDSGFARRFIWSKYHAHPSVLKRLEQGIIEWRKDALVNGFNVKLPVSQIKMQLTEEESRKILVSDMRFQSDTRTPFITAKKIVSTLLWKFNKEPERAWRIWNDFATSLSKDGTELTLEKL